MIISDLSYLEPVAQASAILGSGSVMIFTASVALGDSTRTNATTSSFVKQLPFDGFIAIGIGRASAMASDPLDPATSIGIAGTVDGNMTKIITNTHGVDIGFKSLSGGHIVAIGITPPSP